MTFCDALAWSCAACGLLVALTAAIAAVVLYRVARGASRDHRKTEGVPWPE